VQDAQKGMLHRKKRRTKKPRNSQREGWEVNRRRMQIKGMGRPYRRVLVSSRYRTHSVTMVLKVRGSLWRPANSNAFRSSVPTVPKQGRPRSTVLHETPPLQTNGDDTLLVTCSTDDRTVQTTPWLRLWFRTSENVPSLTSWRKMVSGNMRGLH
jgi:hypothetical protein